MSETDYSHRDLCSATSGMLEAYLDISDREHKDLDHDTVVAIVEDFIELHEEQGAETPTPNLD